MAGNTLKPWMRWPFELIQHAEEHFKAGEDFDRKIALVGYDNAIEASVMTYLGLNPIQRGNRQYEKAKVEEWLRNFHKKAEFLEQHAAELGLSMRVSRDEIIFYHSLRNGLYHDGNGYVPDMKCVQGVRDAALWTFSALFSCDPEPLLLAGLHVPCKTPATNTDLRSAASVFIEALIATKRVWDDWKKLAERDPAAAELLSALRSTIEPNGSPSDADPGSIIADAEELKSEIAESDFVVADDGRLRTQAARLDRISETLGMQLRHYQQHAISAAINATIPACSGNGKAGVVVLPTGSGLARILQAYLEECGQLLPARFNKQIILVERRIEAEQLIRLYRESRNCNQHKILQPVSANQWLSAMGDSDSATIIATINSVRALPVFHDKHCLIAGLNLINTPINLSNLFPKGVFILFTSLLPAKSTQLLHTFGKIISEYSLRDAIADGFIQPIPVHKLEVDWKYYPCENWDTALAASINPIVTTAANIQELAKAIYRDVSTRLQAGAIKGLIVVDNKRFAQLFEQEFREHICSDGSTPTIAVAALTSETDRSLVIYQFAHGDAQNLLILTKHQLIGLDLPQITACYLTCTVSHNVLTMLVSRMGRKTMGLQNRIIVDCADNYKYLQFLQTTLIKQKYD